jgi:hypothetical protein
VDLGFVAMDLRPKVQAGLILDVCLFHSYSCGKIFNQLS